MRRHRLAIGIRALLFLALVSVTACKGSGGGDSDALNPLCESLCQAQVLPEPDADVEGGDSSALQPDSTAPGAGCTTTQIEACKSACQALTTGASTLCISCRLDGASFNSAGMCESTFRPKSACIDICGQ